MTDRRILFFLTEFVWPSSAVPNESADFWTPQISTHDFWGFRAFPGVFHYFEKILELDSSLGVISHNPISVQTLEPTEKSTTSMMPMNKILQKTNGYRATTLQISRYQEICRLDAVNLTTYRNPKALRQKPWGLCWYPEIWKSGNFSVAWKSSLRLWTATHDERHREDYKWQLQNSINNTSNYKTVRLSPQVLGVEGGKNKIIDRPRWPSCNYANDDWQFQKNNEIEDDERWHNFVLHNIVVARCLDSTIAP